MKLRQTGSTTTSVSESSTGLNSSTGFNPVSKIDQNVGGTYRITYNVTDGNLNAQPVTRVITLPPSHILTSMSGYVSYTELGWKYTQDLNGRPEGDTNYTYEISTGGPDVNSFNNNIIQSINKTSFEAEKVFFGLNSYTTYYSRVRASGDSPAIGSISSNYTDPCTSFSATREVDTSTGIVTLNVTTTDASEGVYIIEELVGNSIRGLVKPVADDEFDALFLACGEGLFRTSSNTAGGRLVFDAGFLKYRNGQHLPHGKGWRSSYVDNIYASSTPVEFAFMKNAFDFCSANRKSQTNKVLYINDMGDGGFMKYGIQDFDTTLSGIAQAGGRTLEYLDGLTGTSSGSTQTSGHQTSLEDTTRTAAQWKTYFDGYDVVVWFGVNQPTAGAGLQAGLDNYTVSQTLIDGLLDYFDEGGGLVVVTDHDGFQSQINQVVLYYGIQFYGNTNRSSASKPEQYRISHFLDNTEYIPQGYHPLFAEMDSNAVLTASASEGSIGYVSDPGTGASQVTGRTSSYTSNASKTLTITTHSDGTAIGRGKLIVRTANDCGKVFEPLCTPLSDAFITTGYSISPGYKIKKFGGRGGSSHVFGEFPAGSEDIDYTNLWAIDYLGVWRRLPSQTGMTYSSYGIPQTNIGIIMGKSSSKNNMYEQRVAAFSTGIFITQTTVSRSIEFNGPRGWDGIVYVGGKDGQQVAIRPTDAQIQTASQIKICTV